MPSSLSADELQRYERQILMGEIGTEGQKRLKRARVLICGAGGLGSPAAIYLTVAGIGHVTLVDHDTIDLSNLNRQVLHIEADIGRYKVDSAREKLNQLNSEVTVKACREALTAEGAVRILSGHDVIIDAVDNQETRYIVNKAALKLGIPLIHGAVSDFEGQVMTVLPGQSTCLRCLSRGPVEPAGTIPVIGVTPAVIGALQATEAIKYILGVGELMTDRLLRYDGLKLKWRELRVRRNPQCEHCGLLEKGHEV
ncbi:MAG: HesA/MoeB/ThiF family protein [Desulfovermiculus sp.]|nr:HesA/MoeB/ThiF family protein [Desulfovermiculus sp.]